jgi:hypothetical protein
MEIQKEYNLRYLLAKVRTTWRQALDRLQQRANKHNKNRVERLPTSEQNRKIILSDEVRRRFGGLKNTHTHSEKFMHRLSIVIVCWKITQKCYVYLLIYTLLPNGAAYFSAVMTVKPIVQCAQDTQWTVGLSCDRMTIEYTQHTWHIACYRGWHHPYVNVLLWLAVDRKCNM